jgi:hypothetical protein
MGDDLTTFIVPEVMKNPEALIFRIPKGLIRLEEGELYVSTFIRSWKFVLSLKGKKVC